MPAWPFVSLSFAFGVFALGPYFALWKPSKQAQSPPAQQELQGWRNLGLKATESKIAGFVLLAGNIILLGQVSLYMSQTCRVPFKGKRHCRLADLCHHHG